MRSLPNIIKASQYERLDGTVTIISTASARINEAEVRRKQILHDASEEARKILESAQAYSAKLIQDGQKRLEEEKVKVCLKSQKEGFHEGFEQGRSEGFDDGYAQGLQEALHSQEQILDTMKELLEETEAQKQMVLERFSSDIQNLAFEIARKITHMEVSKDDQALSAIIADATEAYRSQAWIKLTIPQNMGKWIDGEGGRILSELHKVSDNVKITTSADLEDGDCLIDLPEQYIDAGVKSQLSRVKTALQL